jgi:2-isopropylmalate synthase
MNPNSLPEPPDSRSVRILDTTLRDGTQGEGISLSVTDKLRIARRLDAFGVAFIEGGWPGSNPKDVEFFRRAEEHAWENATIVAFGATRRAESITAEDAGLRALVDARVNVCVIFGKSHPLHVTEVLRTTKDENLRMIEESVAFLRGQGRRVIFDAEHFFDGFRADEAYALETLRAASRGGAEVLVLCDTNGGSLPWYVEAAVGTVRRAIEKPLGIHAHNDAGCAVANALSAVHAGVRHVQGTINGYGERCGNTNLCTVIPTLEHKFGLRCVPAEELQDLYDLSRFVSEVANIAPDEQQPYVGRSAFAHKAGVHVAALQHHPDSYQHIDPASVGNNARVIVSELSGKSNVLSKAKELGLNVESGAELEVLERIKEDEWRGSSYEAAEASVALMLHRKTAGYQPPFELLDYKVMVGQRVGQETFSEATIKIAVGDHILHTAAEGNGPVNALDQALRKALAPVYPMVLNIQLVDYKVRILDSKEGTGATTRVLVDSRDGEREWSTVGASTNIIEASWRALADSIEYGILSSAQEVQNKKQ